MASLRSIAPSVVLLGNSFFAAAAPTKGHAVPSLAQVINLKSLNVLPSVPTAEEYNASSVSIYPHPYPDLSYLQSH